MRTLSIELAIVNGRMSAVGRLDIQSAVVDVVTALYASTQ